MVAPHHGSRTSSSIKFIDIVKPELGLFPVAYRNRYHFPAKTVTDRYLQRNITQYDNAANGAIQFKIGINKMSAPLLYRQQTKTIWSAETTD